jgi:hypothetical protein
MKLEVSTLPKPTVSFEGWLAKEQIQRDIEKNLTHFFTQRRKTRQIKPSMYPYILILNINSKI